jgi:hypothetical protein
VRTKKISREAVTFGAVAASIDARLIVDFRSFSCVTPNPNNTLTFEDTLTDGYGMPQPTFNFERSSEDKKNAHKMMLEYVPQFIIVDRTSIWLIWFDFSMCEIAGKIGGFLPGSEPQFLPAGVHLAGT